MSNTQTKFSTKSVLDEPLTLDDDISDWVPLDQNVINKPKPGVGGPVYTSIFRSPLFARGQNRAGGRFVVQFRYYDKENVVSTHPSRFMTFFCGCRTGRIFEVDIRADKVRTTFASRKMMASVLMPEMLRRLITNQLNDMLKVRTKMTAHVDLIINSLRDYRNEIFASLSSSGGPMPLGNSFRTTT